MTQRRNAALVLVVAVLAGLISAAPVAAASKLKKAPSSSFHTFTPAAQKQDIPFSIVTSPSLQPAFNPSIRYYAIACTTSPTTTVSTTGEGGVTIGGQHFSGQQSDLSVPLVANQDLTISKGGISYYIRCLPSDFPAYSASVTGVPQAKGYLVTIPPYTIVFDNQGVPVWWYRDNNSGVLSPIDAKFLNNNTIAWWDASTNGYLLYSLSGTPKGQIGGGDVPLDLHDLQTLPNGNHIAIQAYTTDCPAVPSTCVDLSSWGLSSQSSITDERIVELNKQNQVVWQWDVADHIDVATANVNWRDQYPDVIHMNSLQYDGHGGIIFSARHFDAVYRIDMKTGDITWKLGGSPAPQSLTVSGDPYTQLFSGQHFARLLPDGTLTVHDNGTRANRAPRGVHFSLNVAAHTATEIGQITDPRVTYSACCGSATIIPGGDWLVDWGYNDYISELSPTGVPQITITWPGQFSYRVEVDKASLPALRKGMDAMVAPLEVTSTG